MAASWTVAVGAWEPGTRGYGPASDTPQSLQYLAGGYVRVIRKS